jgi:uncharacterized protein (TIGR03086 family)
MTEIADRYAKVADTFTQRAKAVPADAWDRPAPCEGWVARDVVRHMVEWMPGFFEANAAVEMPTLPPVDADPVGAWIGLSGALQAVLDNPDLATQEFETPAGHYTGQDAVATFCLPDVLIHTWDLARATGQDETLDPEEVHRLYEGMLAIEQLLRDSGHYGPRVDVPADADEQTKLIAFTGRHP